MKENAVDQLNEDWLKALRKKKWGLAASIWSQHASVLRVNARVGENSVLFHFMKHGQKEWLNTMIQAGACWSSRNEGGKTPLMLAADYRNVYAVKRALASGCSVNQADDNGETALMRAVRGGSLAMVRLLIRSGGDVNQKNKEGQHALFFVAKNFFNKFHVRHENDHETCEWLILNELLEAGADLNHQDHKGQTVLMQRFGSRELECLLQKGAAVNVKDHEGLTALMIKASDHESRSLVKLIEHGALVNDQDHEGRTAVMHGLNPCWLSPWIHSYWGLKETLIALILGGADLNLQDHQKKTAVDYAKEKCLDYNSGDPFEEIKILLETHQEFQSLQCHLQEKGVHPIKRL